MINKTIKESESKTIRVPAIKDGIVIDHIPSGKAIKVLEILNVHQDKKSIITAGINLNSKKMGKKDVLKIENKNIEKQEFDKISLVAPNASIAFIKNYNVFDKMAIQIPDFVDNIVKCNNYNCITNHQPVKTKFDKVNIKNNKSGKIECSEIKFRCHYCEKIENINEIELK